MEHIKTVTVVDDDDVFVYLTTKIMKQTRLVDSITVFSNGLDALDFIKANRENVEVLPKIMFLDLSMPIMNGWQFLTEYASLNLGRTNKMTIYICSSSISPDDVSRAKTFSAVSDYIIKPITKDKFVEIIQGYSQA